MTPRTSLFKKNSYTSINVWEGRAFSVVEIVVIFFSIIQRSNFIESLSMISSNFFSQILLTVSSEENIANIEDIRTKHIGLVSDNSSEDLSNMPVVINQGFSIHGNEASGSNAALLYAYYLAAAEGSEIEETLKNTALLKPMMVPPFLVQSFS